MNMLVSGVSNKDGNKVAYVSFQEEDCFAEIMIPDCKVIKNTGFTEDETEQLIRYLKDNMTMIKKEAASVNPIKNMMRES